MSATLLPLTKRHRCFIFAITVAVALTVATGCGCTEKQRISESIAAGLEMVQLDSAVFAAIRKDPLSLAVNSNSLIIVRDTDVVVVDAQFTREATRETIAAIRGITEKPVGYVINTHWHDDHVAGNQVYQDSFPSARFVAQENTAADLQTLGAENRKNQVEGAPPVADEYERLLSRGLGIDSTPASPLERSSVESAIRIVRQYLKEHPGFRAVTATDTVRRRMTLGEGRERLDLLWFGRGNTRGDLVVHLPARGIVATGDLVVAPIPLAFGSYPASWINVLDSLIALQPQAIVPGHGPVMRDLRYVRSVRDWLARIHRETSAAVARGDSLGAVLEVVTLDDVRRAVTGDEKWMNFLFRRFFVRPAVRSAYQQADGRTGGQGDRRPAGPSTVAASTGSRRGSASPPPGTPAIQPPKVSAAPRWRRRIRPAWRRSICRTAPERRRCRCGMRSSPS